MIQDSHFQPLLSCVFQAEAIQLDSLMGQIFGRHWSLGRSFGSTFFTSFTKHIQEAQGYLRFKKIYFSVPENSCKF